MRISSLKLRALLEALGPVGVRGLDGEPDELSLADVGEGCELDEGVEGDLGMGIYIYKNGSHVEAPP